MQIVEQLGPQGDLMELLTWGSSAPRREAVRSNAHIHLPPNFSAFTTTAQALQMARDEDVAILGTSNYYDYSVYTEFAEGCLAAGIFPILGTEIIARDASLATAGVKVNDPGNPGKIYFCGKAIVPSRAESHGREILSRIRRNDTKRMASMAGLANHILQSRGIDLSLSESSVIDLIQERYGAPRDTIYLQERHLCLAVQQGIFHAFPERDTRRDALAKALGAEVNFDPNDAIVVQDQVRSHLLKAGKPAFVEEEFITLDESIGLILQLGGIPSYPTLADGVNPITPFEGPVQSLIEHLKRYRIVAAEFIPIRNDAAMLEEYIPALRREGIIVSAGTEHNTNALIPIVPTCRGGMAIPDKVAAIFLEAAHVLVAHQFLALRGLTGYVDSEGKLNEAFNDGEERIAAFRALGERLVQECRASVR